MHQSQASSFLSPPAQSARAGVSSQTPYVRNRYPLLSPLIAGTANKWLSPAERQENFEEFLYNAYIHVEVPSKVRVFTARNGKIDQDDILTEVDACVREKIKQYTSKELSEIRRFYREFSPSICAMMECLYRFTSEIPSELKNATMAGLEKLGASGPEFSLKDRETIEAALMTAAAKLNRFNLLFQQILAKPTWCNTKLARAFYMAFLGLAVGASLHFIPVVGLAIALPLALDWLFLLVNALGPALMLAATCGLSTYAALSCFSQASPQKIVLTADAVSAVQPGVERLLVQVTQAVLIKAKVARPISTSNPEDGQSKTAQAAAESLSRVDDDDEADRGALRALSFASTPTKAL